MSEKLTIMPDEQQINTLLNRWSCSRCKQSKFCAEGAECWDCGLISAREAGARHAYLQEAQFYAGMLGLPMPKTYEDAVRMTQETSTRAKVRK